MNKTIIALTLVALLSGCDIQTPKFQAVSSGGKTYILNNHTGEIKELPSATNEGISKGISAEVLKKYVEADETPEVVKQFCLKLLSEEFKITRSGRFWITETK